MSKKKFGAWLSGILAAAATAIITTRGGHNPPPKPVDPPAPTTFTLIVHLCDGPCSLDQKIPGAALHLASTTIQTDTSGNGEFAILAAGTYEVCADATRFVHKCATLDVTTTNQELSIELERAIDPTLQARADGRFFATNAGTFRPLFQSGLTLLVRSDAERDAFLDQTRDLGFNGVRVFAGELSWAPQTPTQARANLHPLLDAAAARGLYVYVCALTGAGFDAEAHLREVAAIAAVHPNAILEVANETGHASQSDLGKDPDRLLAVARHVVPAGVLWTLGSPVNEENRTSASYDGGLFSDQHLDRGRDKWNQVRRVREIAGISESTKKPAMNGEPIGSAETSVPGRRLHDPEFWWTMGALCRGFEVGCVFHSEDGLNARLLGQNQLQDARAFTAGFRAIPTGDRFQFFNAGWQGSPVAAANFETGIVRAYSFTSGNHGYTVLVGVTGDPAVRWGGGWRSVGTVASQPGAQILEIAR